MIVNRTIVDDFLKGKDISQQWIFSEIQEGSHLFDLSDATQKSKEVAALTDRISDMVGHFEPCNAGYYRRLFPDFKKVLEDVEIVLTVGVPAPYDAMVMEKNGREVIVFDMGRFLSYQDPEGFARQMLTHESTHTLLHQRWQEKKEASYQEKLRFLAFDEGFAHLLACGKELCSFDAAPWLQQYKEPAFASLRQALACEDTEQQKEWLYRAQAGRYWEKFAAIAGKLYLLEHLQQLDEIYLAGPDHFMPQIFDASERN